MALHHFFAKRIFWKENIDVSRQQEDICTSNAMPLSNLQRSLTGDRPLFAVIRNDGEFCSILNAISVDSRTFLHAS